MEPSDSELIRACRGGDEAAWDALVARYQGLVYTIARRAGLGQDAAADVFQRVFAALVEQLDQIREPDRLGAWLVTIARREVWRARHGGHALEIGFGHVSELLGVSEGASPDERLLRGEERDAVRAALGALDERCQRLLLLLFDRPEPPSYAEVAALMEISEGSIGPTRARCLEKLRRLLESLDG